MDKVEKGGEQYLFKGSNYIEKSFFDLAENSIIGSIM